MTVNKSSRATRLVLFAHGETAATRAGAFPRDETLTMRGRGQAEELRPALSAAAAAWCSPAAAAHETAMLLGYGSAIADAALADLDCGRWCGLALGTVAAREPEAVAAWAQDPDWRGHGGESVADLLARTTTWLAARRCEGVSGIVVTHAAVLRGAILAVLHAPASGFWAIDVAPLTRLVLTSDGRRWALRGLNCHGVA